MSEVYPTTPVPNWPYDIKINWNTTVSSFDSGKEQRRQKNLYPKYDVTLTYTVLSLANMQILWNFYQARKGTFEPIYFYSLESTTWSGCYLGIGDGTTTTFDIPGKSTSNVQIYVSGVALRATGVSDILLEDESGLITEDGDTIIREGPEEYTLLTGGGAGSWTVILNRTGNALITCDFTDTESGVDFRKSFHGLLYNLIPDGDKIKGLANVKLLI